MDENGTGFVGQIVNGTVEQVTVVMTIADCIWWRDNMKALNHGLVIVVL